MRSNMFWGIFFIAFGLILLINYVFGINLPIFRILFAVFIIYLGFKMLFGSFGVDFKTVASESQAIFSKSKFSEGHSTKDNFGNGHDYQTIFGEGELDLSNSDLNNTKHVTLQNVFGKTKVYLKKGAPYFVEADIVFGKIKLPEKHFSALGEWSYKSDNFDAGKPYIHIQTDIVFGEVVVITD